MNHTKQEYEQMLHALLQLPVPKEPKAQAAHYALVGKLAAQARGVATAQ